MIYNTNFDICGLILISIILIYSYVKYVPTPSMRKYQELCAWIILSDILDITTSFCFNHPGILVLSTVVILNTMFYAVYVCTAFAFVRYVSVHTDIQGQRSLNLWVNIIVILSFFAFLLLNIFHPLLFYFDEGLNYHNGPFHYVGYIIVLYFFADAIFVTLRYRHAFKSSEYRSTFFFIGISLTGVIIQMFLGNVLTIFFALSIALLIVLFMYETPDYVKLSETMEALEVARQDAEKAAQAKTSFLANMSHEIRTPITAVLGLDELIIRESNDEKIREYARDIQESGKTLLGIINDILDFSKVEAGKLDIIPEDYKITTLVTDLQNMMSLKAFDRGLYLIIKADPDIPSVLYGDDIRIKQVAINIISNAIKYTDKGGATMTISHEKVDDEHVDVTFTVKDTGRGIKQEDLERLFQPFERIEESRDRKIEGTGLGISITQKLLEGMGSSLEVQSIYGVGSIFSFKIRQEVRDWTPSSEKSSSSIQPSANDENTYQESFIAPDASILVIDDAPLNLTVFTGLLKQTQVQIDTAESGAEGLALAQKKTYHIIFVDHLMPEMDGIETMQAIREDDSMLNMGTPIIALTANAVNGSRETYLNAGFNDYLSKPINPSILENMMIQYLPQDLVERK